MVLAVATHVATALPTVYSVAKFCCAGMNSVREIPC